MNCVPNCHPNNLLKYSHRTSDYLTYFLLAGSKVIVISDFNEVSVTVLSLKDIIYFHTIDNINTNGGKYPLGKSREKNVRITSDF
jgi:hypothetical protein